MILSFIARKNLNKLPVLKETAYFYSNGKSQLCFRGVFSQNDNIRAFSGCCLSNLLPANVGNYIQEALNCAKIEIVTVVECK